MARLVLSLNERLIIHLSEMDRHKDDPDVPVDASQEGISRRLGTGVHTVSRMLSPMVKEGLISENLAHVRGVQKRRKVYFLTESGMKAARALRTDIATRKIVLEHDGRAQEMSFEEAMRRIGSASGITPGFSEMVDLASANDVLRMEMFPKPTPAKKCSSEFVERSQGRPRVERFFGREAERKSILDQLESPDVSAFLIWGMPGIGKSTLASKVFDELSGRRSMFWYSFREWDTESSFLSTLADFLLSTGHQETATGIKRGSSPAEMFMPLVRDLSGCGAVLFLDDVQKCSRPVLSLLSLVTEAARISKSSKSVLISRTIPAFFSNTVQGNVTVELGGLDRDSAWHMAQSVNAKDSVRIVDESHGHPMLLNLMARGGSGQAKGDVISFIEREVYSTVSEKERKVLDILSVFRHPVLLDAIPDTDYTVIAALKQRALVTEQEDGIWIHDLLKEFFSTHLSGQMKLEYHGLAASYCDRNQGAEWKLEALYHLVEAEAWAKALEVAVTNAGELVNDFPEETLSLVSRIPAKSESNRQNAELLFMLGQLQEKLGEEESALAHFERALSLLSAEGNVAKRALVLETQARLRSEIRRWSEALLDHQKALRIYEESKDKEGQTREWMNIGGVLRRKGDFAKAREAYMKALSLATLDEDRIAEAACLNNIGLLDRDEGRLRDAEVRLKESIRLAHAVKDPSGEARALENLAELYRVELKLDEMIGLLMESSEAFKRAGEMEEYKRLQAACAEALGGQGKYAEGIRLAEAALENPDIRKRKGLFQKTPRFDSGDLALSEIIINLHRSESDRKKAQKELVRFVGVAESLGDKGGLARGKLLQAIIHEDLGDFDSSAKSLDDAEMMLKSAGNSEGLVAVHMRRGDLEEKRGDLAAAARHYHEAADQAERVNNEFARRLAMDRLDSISTRASGKPQR